MKQKHLAFAALALALALGDTAAAAQAAAPPAPAAEAARPRRQSWTADRRDFAIGDVITVLVDEQTLASATTGNSASDRRTRDLDLGASGTGMAASLPATGLGIGTRADAESRNRGEAVRSNRVAAEVSVRVVEVGANGLLRVEGEKQVALDRNHQAISLAGWLRAQDVAANNAVDSWRIADLKLAYSSKGSLGKPKGSIFGRILGALWP